MWKKHQPDFSTLFLNAGAHIQHHYLFSSPAYDGYLENPRWYIKSGYDPLLEVLELYDKVLSELNKLPNTRLMISIGMRQIPYKEPIFYWRLKNHNAFLKKMNISYKSVKPRMTRDFLIEFEKKPTKIVPSVCLKVWFRVMVIEFLMKLRTKVWVYLFH